MNADLEIRHTPLGDAEMDRMAAVAARAFLRDPLATAVFARESDARESRLCSVYEAMLRTQAYPPITAWRDGRALGLVGLTPHSASPVSALRMLQALPRLVRGMRLFELRPAFAWLRAIAGADVSPGDWRLGPVVVEPEMHRAGIGSAILNTACSHLDEQATGAIVSTDIESNVDFYRRFGFEQTGATEVLGQTVWHLRRVSQPAMADSPVT